MISVDCLSRATTMTYNEHVHPILVDKQKGCKDVWSP